MDILSIHTQENHNALVRIAKRFSRMTVLQWSELSDSDMKEIQMVYLDWVNNYLTIEVFAEHYNITRKEAKSFLEMSEYVHNILIDKNEENLIR